MTENIWLQKLTWEEAEECIAASKGTVIIPVGSTEQHGRHLPLGTDAMVAIALAESAARQAGVLVAPPLWYGWSPHHMVLPGTITIRPEILAELLFDVMQSLYVHGLTRFVLLNGHRIVNITWMQIAAERAKRRLGIKAVIFDPAYMSKQITRELGWGEVGHADEIETSHMWHAYPELVKMERACDNPHRHSELYHVDPQFAGDTLCYVPSTAREQEFTAHKYGGVSGEPSKASPSGGQRYHEHLVKRLVQVIYELQQD